MRVSYSVMITEVIRSKTPNLLAKTLNNSNCLRTYLGVLPLRGRTTQADSTEPPLPLPSLKCPTPAAPSSSNASRLFSTLAQCICLTKAALRQHPKSTAEQAKDRRDNSKATTIAAPHNRVGALLIHSLKPLGRCLLVLTVACASVPCPRCANRSRLD